MDHGHGMMKIMDNATLVLILTVSLWALGVIISLLVAYWVIRLGVTHALRSHHYWVSEQKRG